MRKPKLTLTGKDAPGVSEYVLEFRLELRGKNTGGKIDSAYESPTLLSGLGL